MELSVVDKTGKDTGRKVTLSERVFGVEEPNEHVVYLDVKHFLANQRQGTHKAKERGEVSGSKKKPYRQKGTGSARAGHKRSPLWRHGGRVFGPKPRDYGFKLNKKTKALARACALTYKAQEDNIKLLENFSMDAPKTKEFVEILSNLDAAERKVLMVLPEGNANIYLSGRNLPKANVVRASDLNTYDILNHDMLVIVEEAVEIINKIR